jgi:hypothetical protein
MQFPIYESHLRNMIEAIRTMSSFHLTPKWKEDLDQEGRDTEFWTTAISECTVDAVKELLSRDEPPSPEDFRALPVISSDLIDPGSYLGVTEMEDKGEEGDCFVYQGSATRVGRGLGHRTILQHSNPEYREKELS